MSQLPEPIPLKIWKTSSWRISSQIGVAGDEQPLAVVQALGAEEQRLPPEPAHPARHVLLTDDQVAELTQEGRLHPVAGATDAAVGLQPQAKRDLLRAQRRDRRALGRPANPLS